MAKGYNRRNFLLRVKDIQDIYLQHHARGCTDKFIYQNHIYPTYKIGWKIQCKLPPKTKRFCPLVLK